MNSIYFFFFFFKSDSKLLNSIVFFFCTPKRSIWLLTTTKSSLDSLKSVRYVSALQHGDIPSANDSKSALLYLCPGDITIVASLLKAHKCDRKSGHNDSCDLSSSWRIGPHYSMNKHRTVTPSSLYSELCYVGYDWVSTSMLHQYCDHL